MDENQNYGGVTRKKGLVKTIIIGVTVFIAFILVWITNAKNTNSIIRINKNAERLTVNNPNAAFYGGVSFDITFDEYIDNYNDAVNRYIDDVYAGEGYGARETAKKNSTINAEKFSVSAFDDYNEYIYIYDDIFIYDVYKKGGEAFLAVRCDPVTDRVIQVFYYADAYLYDSGDESINNLWTVEKPFYAFGALSTDFFPDLYTNDMRKYGRGVYIYRFFIPELDNKIPHIAINVTACSEDSDYYKGNVTK